MPLGFIDITSIIYLTIGVLILLLGILIFRENPNQRLNRATGVMMFLAALAPIMGAFGMLIKKVSPNIDIDLSVLTRIFLIWEFFFPQLLLFSLLFPRENAVLKNYPKIVPLIYIPHTVHFIVVLLFRSSESILSLIRFSEESVNLFLQPLFIIFNLIITLLSSIYEYHNGIFAVINLLYVLLAIFIMHQGYLELNRPRYRKQVGLVLWGIRISVGLYAIIFLLPKISAINVSEKLNYVLTIFALIIGPGSIALSIIKYQFLDIRLILRRGIIFSMTSGLLVGIYLLIYSQAKRIVAAIFGFDVPLVEIFFLVLAVIFFQPILSSIEETVERIFVSEKSDYRNVLKTLSHDILHIIDLQQLKEKIIATLTETMMLENIRLLLKNKAYLFVADFAPNPDRQMTIEFTEQGEFISMLKMIAEPIKVEEVLTRVTNEHERKKLYLLNSTIFSPLIHHGEISGVLCLGKKLSKAKFSAEDLTMLRVLSDQIAIALENIELYEQKLEKQIIEEEISVSREIQRMLLPHDIPQGRNFELSAINLSSKAVGGDYYDFIKIDEQHLGLAIGDISGKGIPGAILMSNLQATLRAVAAFNLSPSNAVFRVNNQITATTSTEKFATFLYGIFNSQKLTFNYTNAGHNYPILRRSFGDCQYLADSDLIIGIQKDFSYRENTLKLQQDDVLVFYTDGITEAMNAKKDEFSEQQLLDIIRHSNCSSAEELRNHILEKLLDFTQGINQYDDITLIVLRVK